MGLLIRKLEEWAEIRSEKTFFYYGEENLHTNYKAFNQIANNLAFNLQAMGIKKGDRVSLFLTNPRVIVLAMFASWKIGAVFCPINFLYKGRLLSYQINDTKPKILITEKGREPILNEIQSEIKDFPIILYSPKKGEHDFNADNDSMPFDKKFRCTPWDDLITGEHPNPDVHLDYWDTANIIYTSGTTGEPKGVVQSHRWLQNYCYYGMKLLHSDDVVYCELPLYHIAGAFAQIGRAAWQGCSVAVWDRFNAAEFWNRIRVSKATYTLLIDVMMPRLLQAPEKKDDRNNTLRRVHMQPLPEYHHKFAKRFGIDFVNVGYGATEFGYACAAVFDESGDQEWTPEKLRSGYSKKELRNIAESLGMPVVSGTAPIKKRFMGKACMLHEVAILNEHDEELGPGEYGQIVLRGRLPHVLMKEYLNKPEATKNVFHNFWLHTGDGAYQDKNGIFYFVDRMGGFIRVRGENISSFQIEDTFNTHPKIDVSSAFPVPAEKGLEDDIVVYIVPASGENLSEDELRPWIEKQMPRYMWPKHIRFIDALPQTVTNKVEKYKLKEMFEKSVH
ncbi:MAG: ATP-dependent acyl-CoA ligase [Desulfobacteraceae bacterium]|nr:ATP-dependent acyl-CoA ligase [Desulfobacteraceae bacterium]